MLGSDHEPVADDRGLNSKHFYRQDWHGGGAMTHMRQIGDAIRAIGAIKTSRTADKTALTTSDVNPTFETRRLAFRVEDAWLACSTRWKWHPRAPQFSGSLSGEHGLPAPMAASSIGEGGNPWAQSRKH